MIVFFSFLGKDESSVIEAVEHKFSETMIDGHDAGVFCETIHNIFPKNRSLENLRLVELSCFFFGSVSTGALKL